MNAVRCSWCDGDAWTEHIDKKSGEISHTCKHCKHKSSEMNPRYLPHPEKCTCPVHPTT